MVELNCPTCGKTLRIPDEYRGQTGKCNACGAALLVPKSNVAPVPKWKIGCLNVCAVLAMVFVVIGIFAPKPPEPPEAAPVASGPEPTAPVAQTESPKVRSLEEKLSKVINGGDEKIEPLRVNQGVGQMKIIFAPRGNLTHGMSIFGAKQDVLELLKVAHEERPGFRVVVNGSGVVIDKFGNAQKIRLFTLVYSPETISKINFENILAIIDNAWIIADEATIHPSFGLR